MLPWPNPTSCGAPVGLIPSAASCGNTKHLPPVAGRAKVEITPQITTYLPRYWGHGGIIFHKSCLPFFLMDVSDYFVVGKRQLSLYFHYTMPLGGSVKELFGHLESDSTTLGEFISTDVLSEGFRNENFVGETLFVTFGTAQYSPGGYPPTF